jgi:hypothetical protein
VLAAASGEGSGATARDASLEGAKNAGSSTLTQPSPMEALSGDSYWDTWREPRILHKIISGPD